MIAATGLAAALFASPAMGQAPVGSAFTYQGKLTDAGAPITNACDFRFRLFGVATGGAQIGATLGLENTTPVNGLLTVSLDFGFAAFQGEGRYLEIEIRNPAGTGAWTTLTPRQSMTPVPYALFALNGNPSGSAGRARCAGADGSDGPDGNAWSNGSDGHAWSDGCTGQSWSSGCDGRSRSGWPGRSDRACGSGGSRWCERC